MKDGENPEVNMFTGTVVPKAKGTTETTFIFTVQIIGGFDTNNITSTYYSWCPQPNAWMSEDGSSLEFQFKEPGDYNVICSVTQTNNEGKAWSQTINQPVQVTEATSTQKSSINTKDW